MRKLVVTSTIVGIMVLGTTGVFAASDGGNGKKAVEALQVQIQSLEDQVQSLTAKLAADDQTISQQQATINQLQTQDQNGVTFPILTKGMTLQQLVQAIGSQPTLTLINSSYGDPTYIWKLSKSDSNGNTLYTENIVVPFQAGGVISWSESISN